ncbi:Gfo/Idh/MocA family protein [Actinoplanes sp. CA-015351]|uniref:Gfo/Idh/MocA family protein n=1 Tax=Actinoplanes sp. CA-015351 TaxID=3239897 RepID=UPI003D953F75
MRVGLVGFGDVAGKYADYLGRGFDPPDLLFADSDPAVRARLADAGRPAVDNLTGLLAQAPDAVMILTPPDTHVALAIEAAAGGVAVLVEKPPALRVADLDRMESAEGRVRCIIPYRSMPVFGHAAAFARDGGRIDLRLEVNWPRHDSYFAKPWRRDLQRGGGPLWNTFFHHVDLAAELLRQGRDEPIEAIVHLLDAHRADLDLHGPAGVARLRLSTALTASIERCEVRCDGRTLLAEGLRCSERISIGHDVLHESDRETVAGHFTRAALASLRGGRAHEPHELRSTVALLESVHAGSSRTASPAQRSDRR